MRKYIVNCMHGGGFMSWTKEQPLTRKELLEVFHEYDLADNGRYATRKKELTLKSCSAMWQVDIKLYKEANA